MVFSYFNLVISGDFGSACSDGALPVKKAFYLQRRFGLALSILDTRKPGTLTNSEDPDEMPHKAAFRQDLYCLQK